MNKVKLPLVNVTLDKLVGGGQALATEESGRKLFVWGGLPGETVKVQITKQKSKLAEGVVTGVIKPSKNRISPNDKTSYLSTSPWQIMDFESEQHYKSALIEEAFELHDIVLPEPIEIHTDNRQYEYRNKIEFSWWWNKDTEQLDLAFFKRGTHGKIPVEGTSLAHPNINRAAIIMRDILRNKDDLRASDLKTLLVRCSQTKKVVIQLYVKQTDFTPLDDDDLKNLKNNANVTGFELIYSDPKSPASVITKKLQSYGIVRLDDEILGVNYNYSAEGFFQINLPLYEMALKDIGRWTTTNEPIVDLYSGVGTIGLSVTRGRLTLVESNKQAVSEMRENIIKLGRTENTKVIEAPSERAVESIDGNSIVIVDPPRAGLHDDIVKKILIEKPKQLIYLSCNPATQARDISKLLGTYGIRFHQGYNFFPRTPHIEHLVVLDLIR